MSSINDDLRRSRNIFDHMTPSQKIAYQKLEADSPAYACIGRKCYLCGEIIIRYDVIRPNFVYEDANNENVIHAQCMNYGIAKYPNVPISDLHNKIQRRSKHGL